MERLHFPIKKKQGLTDAWLNSIVSCDLKELHSDVANALNPVKGKSLPSVNPLELVELQPIVVKTES